MLVSMSLSTSYGPRLPIFFHNPNPPNCHLNENCYKHFYNLMAISGLYNFTGEICNLPKKKN